VLRYTGVRTRRPHELVCQYVRDGDQVWVLVGGAEDKTWWHNLRVPADVELWLAGERVRARAVAVEGTARPDECAAGLTVYLARRPRAAAAVGLQPDAGSAAVAEAATRSVMVRADVTRTEA
jgi:hypothetical protein